MRESGVASGVGPSKQVEVMTKPGKSGPISGLRTTILTTKMRVYEWCEKN